MKTDVANLERARRFLAEHQEAHYRALGLQPRNYYDQEFLKYFIPRMVASFPKEIGITKESFEKRLVAQIARSPSPYQDPVMYDLLSRMAKKIEVAIGSSGDTDFLSPVFGTMPTGKVNGYAVGFPKNPYRLIIIEDGLFGFANLMSKAIVHCLAPAPSDDPSKISFTLDEDKVVARLANEPKILQRFFEAIAAYVVTGNPLSAPQYFSETSHLPLVECLLNSMETFVVGHEYGHVIAGHLDVRAAADNGEEAPAIMPTTWQQEFEADVIGLQLMLKARMADGFDLSLSFWGADLFFGCIDIIERSISTLTGATSEKASPTHPPTPMRREMLRMFIRDQDDNGSGAIENAIQLADNMDRLIDRLWDGVQPSLTAMRKKGIEPDIAWRRDS